MDIFINQEKVGTPDRWQGNLISLGTYKDESLNIKVRLKNDTGTFQIPEFYTLNYSNLEKAINTLKGGALEIKEYSDTHVTGEIISPRSGRDALFKYPL